MDFDINFELNHPYFLYPGGPLSEYTNYKIYNKELLRLYEYLKQINNLINHYKNIPSNYILVPVIIGSPMEQAIKSKYSEPNTFYQWQQLFPDYINNFINCFSKKNNSKIYVFIIIVSPDNIFSDSFTHDPFFTYISYEFKKISKNNYEFSDNNLTICVNIFNCPFPSQDARIEVFNKMNNLINKFNSDFSNIEIKLYTQTENDLLFINNFYILLEELYKNNNYKNISIIVNSWACFKNLCGFDGLKMFPKVLELANIYNIIVTEWIYKDNLFLTKVVSVFKSINNNLLSGHTNHTNHTNENVQSSVSNKKTNIKTYIFKQICYVDISSVDNDNLAQIIEYNKSCFHKDKSIYYIDFDDGLYIRHM